MKTFNKVISLVTIAVFVLSMMITPAFAAGLSDFQTPTGNEKLVVTYYSDAALTNAITTAKTGDTVYAKVTVNVPTKTLSSLTANVKVENATIENDNTAVFSSLADFERPVLAGTNVINADKVSANLQISKKITGVFDSPTNYTEYKKDYPKIRTYVYKNIEVDNFDATVYTLNVTGTSGEVAFSLGDKSGIGIGELSDEQENIVLSALGIEGKLTISSGTSTTKKVTYTVDFDETKEYDSTLSEDELKAAILADIKIKKSIDGAVATEISNDDVDIKIDTTKKTINIDFTMNVAEGEGLAEGQENEKNLTYKVAAPAPTPKYVLKTVYFNGVKIQPSVETFNADYEDYKNEADLKAAFTVDMEKFLGSESQDVETATLDDYEVAVTKSPTVNEATVTITFKGKLAGTTAKTYTVTYTNVPDDYSNVKAELTTTEFANNTDAAAVKAAVKVTATKTQGVIKTDNITLTLGTDYTVAIDGDPTSVTASGFVTVTLIGDLTGKTLDPADGKLNFTVTPDMIEYENYSVEFEGGVTKFLATATDEEISAKITVKADKKVSGAVTVVGEVVAPANYTVAIDRSTGTVTFTLKAGTLYADGTIPSQTITFEDVYNYNIGEVTMSPKMFDAAVTDDTIKAAVTVKGEVWKNGTKDSDKTYVLDTDYNVVVDRTSSKVTVKFIGDLTGKADRVFAIAIGVNAQAKITLGAATVNVGDDLKATVNIGGLAATDKIYGAVVEFNITTGAIKNVNIATGYNKVDSASDIKMKEATITLARDMSGTATNKLFEFAIDTTGLAKDDVITVTVTSLKLTTVEGDDVATLPSFTGDSASATVTEVVVPTTAKISAEFNIKTLGDVTSAADKFKSGLTVTKDGAAVVAASNISVTDKKIKLTDLEVEAGTYKVTVNVPGYTKAEVEIKVAYDAESNTMKVDYGTITGEEAIYAGDVNGNGIIDAVDYADLVAKIGQAAAENVNCDLYTKDGEAVINLNDVITMVYEFETCFGKSFSTSGLILE